MESKRVILIYPISVWYWSAPPPGIGYIASSLEAVGCKVKFIDCQITPRYKKLILSLLADYPVVGISVNAGNVSSALDIARAIRKHSPQTRIIMGGPHATAVYDILIPEYADIVVRGEGEDTVTELFQTDDLTKVKGIAYWDGSLKVNPVRPYIEDLDRLRFPAWHLYDLKRYELGNTSSPLAIILTSRGCPYDCIYCVKSIHGYKVRLRSIDNVLSEIDYLVTKLGVREIQIMDDIFTLYPERVKELCRKLIERRYENLSFALSNGIKLNFVDKEMLDLMAKSGFYLICLYWVCVIADLRTADGIREEVDMLGFAKNVVDMAKKAGLKVSLFLQLGLSSDNIDTMNETIDISSKLAVDGAYFAIAVPFPGTRFYEIVKKEGRFLKDLKRESVNCEYGEAVFETANLRASDIEKAFKKSYRKFYFRKAKIWEILLNRNIKNISTLKDLLASSKKILFG